MRLRAGLAAIAVSALLLTGCGQQTNTDTKETLSSTKADINPHPAEDLQDGGDIRVPLQSFPPQWNYYQLDGSLYDASLVENTAFPSVFRFDPDGKESLNEDYVTRAEQTSTEPQTVEYSINEKAVWSDGNPLSWKDFEALWKATNGTNHEFQAGDTTGYRDIESVKRGKTDRDVVVTFSTPFGDWHKLFTRLYPASSIDTPAKFNKGWLDAVPVSAGPFSFDTASLDKTNQTVTVHRNENWWGKRPRLDTITFRVLEGNADVDAFLNNEIDEVTVATTERYKRIEGQPNTDVRKASSPMFNHITFGSRGVFADAPTRLAVSKAVDRAGIVKTLFDGLPAKVDVLNNHLFLGTDAGYADNAGAVGYDLEAAKSELDAAGWKLNGEVRERDGKKFEATMVVSSGASWAKQTAEILQEQLKAVGLKLTIDVVSAETFFKDNITPGNFDLTAFIWAGTGYISDALSIYQDGEDTQNYGKISTPEITEKLNSAAQELDETERNRLINEADTAIWTEGHSLPLAQGPRPVAIRPGIANLGANSGNGGTDWTAVGWLPDKK